MELTILLPMLAAIIIGLVAVLTKAGLPAKFAPLASVVLGVASAALIVTLANAPPTLALMYGIIAGLSACGLYDQSKLITK